MIPQLWFAPGLDEAFYLGSEDLGNVLHLLTIDRVIEHCDSQRP